MMFRSILTTRARGGNGQSNRRTLITTSVNKGFSVRLLSSLVRHSSIATIQRLVDVNDDMLRRAVELV